jgi:hypothetical protein
MIAAEYPDEWVPAFDGDQWRFIRRRASRGRLSSLMAARQASARAAIAKRDRRTAEG